MAEEGRVKVKVIFLFPGLDKEFLENARFPSTFLTLVTVFPFLPTHLTPVCADCPIYCLQSDSFRLTNCHIWLSLCYGSSSSVVSMDFSARAAVGTF